MQAVLRCTWGWYSCRRSALSRGEGRVKSPGQEWVVLHVAWAGSGAVGKGERVGGCAGSLRSLMGLGGRAERGGGQRMVVRAQGRAEGRRRARRCPEGATAGRASRPARGPVGYGGVRKAIRMPRAEVRCRSRWRGPSGSRAASPWYDDSRRQKVFFDTKQIESGSNDDGRAPASATAAQRVAFGRALLRADTPAKSSAAAATMSAGGSVSAGRRPAPPL